MKIKHVRGPLPTAYFVNRLNSNELQEYLYEISPLNVTVNDKNHVVVCMYYNIHGYQYRLISFSNRYVAMSYRKSNSSNGWSEPKDVFRHGYENAKIEIGEKV